MHHHLFSVPDALRAGVPGLSHHSLVQSQQLPEISTFSGQDADTYNNNKTKKNKNGPQSCAERS